MMDGEQASIISFSKVEMTSSLIVDKRDQIEPGNDRITQFSHQDFISFAVIPEFD